MASSASHAQEVLRPFLFRACRVRSVQCDEVVFRRNVRGWDVDAGGDAWRSSAFSRHGPLPDGPAADRPNRCATGGQLSILCIILEANADDIGPGRDNKSLAVRSATDRDR